MKEHLSLATYSQEAPSVREGVVHDCFYHCGECNDGVLHPDIPLWVKILPDKLMFKIVKYQCDNCEWKGRFPQ